jgi:hypothetical protein
MKYRVGEQVRINDLLYEVRTITTTQYENSANIEISLSYIPEKVNETFVDTGNNGDSVDLTDYLKEVNKLGK